MDICRATQRRVKYPQGVSNGPIQFESARKIWPLLELLVRKLDECSLARARKIFASARMLGFSLKFPAV